MDQTQSHNPITEAKLLEELKDTPASGKPVFEPLEGGAESVASPPPQLESEKKVEPWTSKQIVDGSAFVTLIVGSQLARIKIESAAQAETLETKYKEAFAKGFGGILPTEYLIETLKVGPALAHYGYGQNMQLGSLENLPPLVRIGLGAAVMGLSSYMAMTAVRHEAKEQMAGAGSGSSSDSATSSSQSEKQYS